MTKQNKKPAENPNAGTTAAATKTESTATADANLTAAGSADGASTVATGAAGVAGAASAGAAGTDKSDTKKQKVKALQVVAKVESFRRGGRVFNRTETTVPLDELTVDQIKQIKGEPLLTVSEVEVDAE